MAPSVITKLKICLISFGIVSILRISGKNILSAFHGIIPDISLKYEHVILGYTHESEQSDGFYLFNLIF